MLPDATRQPVLDAARALQTEPTVDHVRAFFDALAAADIAFHCDEPLAEVVAHDTGSPCFSAQEAAELDETMEVCHVVAAAAGVDVYELALSAALTVLAGPDAEGMRDGA
jgi:hypothetical protein